MNAGWSRAYRTGEDYFLIDINSSQSCASLSPLKINKYHYGGMAIRGADEWFVNEKNAQQPSDFLTSEGKTTGRRKSFPAELGRSSWDIRQWLKSGHRDLLSPGEFSRAPNRFAFTRASRISFSRPRSNRDLRSNPAHLIFRNTATSFTTANPTRNCSIACGATLQNPPKFPSSYNHENPPLLPHRPHFNWPPALCHQPGRKAGRSKRKVQSHQVVQGQHPHPFALERRKTIFRR